MSHNDLATWWAELAIVAMLFAIGTFFGARAVQGFRDAGYRQDFYQPEFGPAVMLACGRGYVSPSSSSTPALEAFLAERTQNLSCSELSARPPTIEPFHQFQRTGRYLEWTVAAVWWLGGVSWPHLAWLSGVMFGAVVILTYGIFRLAAPAALALIAEVPILMSTFTLTLTPHIRDFAKGPFLLAVILIIGRLAVDDRSPRSLLGLAAAAGAVVGIGLGFRNDLLIAIPPVVVALALLVPREVPPLRRLAAVCVFAAAFATSAAPVLADYSKGSNTGHVMLLGLTRPFDNRLGLSESIYDFGSQYKDELAFAMVESYAIRVERRADDAQMSASEYERAAVEYVVRVVATFPADVVTRVIAASRAVPRFFLDYYLNPPPWIHTHNILRAFYLRAMILSRLGDFAVASIVLVLVLLASRSPREAFAGLMVLLTFAGGSATQFDQRHFYYLEFVPWWAFLCSISLALKAFSKTQIDPVIPPHAIRNSLMFVGSLVVVLATVVTATRIVQQRRATALFAGYEAAPRRASALLSTPRPDGKILMGTPEMSAPLVSKSPLVVTRVFEAEFDRRSCPTARVPATFRYEAGSPNLDFSDTVTIDLQEGGVPTLVFVPAFERPLAWTRFRGIELPGESARCLKAIFEVSMDHEPLLLRANLGPGWRDTPLYQRLGWLIFQT